MSHRYFQQIKTLFNITNLIIWAVLWPPSFPPFLFRFFASVIIQRQKELGIKSEQENGDHCWNNNWTRHCWIGNSNERTHQDYSKGERLTTTCSLPVYNSQFQLFTKGGEEKLKVVEPETNEPKVEPEERIEENGDDNRMRWSASTPNFSHRPEGFVSIGSEYYSTQYRPKSLYNFMWVIVYYTM